MAKLRADQAFAVALEHHRAGRLAEAERGYRGVLADEPEHARHAGRRSEHGGRARETTAMRALLVDDADE